MHCSELSIGFSSTVSDSNKITSSVPEIIKQTKRTVKTEVKGPFNLCAFGTIAFERGCVG